MAHPRPNISRLESTSLVTLQRPLSPKRDETVQLGERVEEAGFLAINKAHIICVRDLASEA
jgi:hypothetical protein